MMEETELMSNMTKFVESATERLGRIDRRMRNEPDESSGECFDFINRRLISAHDVEKLSAALWAMIVQANQAFSTARYWRDFVEPMKSRVHFFDEENEEREETGKV